MNANPLNNYNKIILKMEFPFQNFGINKINRILAQHLVIID